MAEDHPDRAADLERARLIVGEYGTVIGPAGTMSEHVALAVADGIAFGRKQGLAMALDAIARLQGEHKG